MHAWSCLLTVVVIHTHSSIAIRVCGRAVRFSGHPLTVITHENGRYKAIGCAKNGTGGQTCMPSTPEPSLLCQITIHHFTKLKESNEYLNLLKIIYRSLLKVRNSCNYICHYPQVFTLHLQVTCSVISQNKEEIYNI